MKAKRRKMRVDDSEIGNDAVSRRAPVTATPQLSKYNLPRKRVTQISALSKQYFNIQTFVNF